jgi:type III restriction enzyme
MKNDGEMVSCCKRPLLYLVRETKSTHDLTQLRPDEARKIACGECHFAALGANYKLVRVGERL